MVTHSSILAWEIPWIEGPGRLQSLRSQRVGHNCLSTNTNSLHLLFELFLAYPRFFLSSLEQEVLLIKSLYIVLGSRFMKPPKQKQTFLTLISSLCGH